MSRDLGCIQVILLSIYVLLVLIAGKMGVFEDLGRWFTE